MCIFNLIADKFCTNTSCPQFLSFSCNERMFNIAKFSFNARLRCLLFFTRPIALSPKTRNVKHLIHTRISRSLLFSLLYVHSCIGRPRVAAAAKRWYSKARTEVDGCTRFARQHLQLSFVGKISESYCINFID